MATKVKMAAESRKMHIDTKYKKFTLLKKAKIEKIVEYV